MNENIVAFVRDLFKLAQDICIYEVYILDWRVILLLDLKNALEAG